MDWELSVHLGRKRYERNGTVNHRNGSYPCLFTIKGIGEVKSKSPSDRHCTFKTKVLPQGDNMKMKYLEINSSTFLSGISTRSLSLLSNRLVGLGSLIPKLANLIRN